MKAPCGIDKELTTDKPDRDLAPSDIPNRVHIKIKTNGLTTDGYVIETESGEEIPCAELHVQMRGADLFRAVLTCVACPFEYEGPAEVVCGRAPICPACGEQMTHAIRQDAVGDWYSCWLCGCKPAPERVAELEAQFEEWTQDLKHPDPRKRYLDPVFDKCIGGYWVRLVVSQYLPWQEVEIAQNVNRFLWDVRGPHFRLSIEKEAECTASYEC